MDKQNPIIETQFFPEDMLCIAKVTHSESTIKKLVAGAIDFVYNSDFWVKDMNVVFDLREVTKLSDTDYIMSNEAAKAVFSSTEDRIGESYRAVVVSNEIVFGSLRQYIAVRKLSAGEFKVFYNYTEALTWLKLDDDPKYNLEL